MTINQVKNPTYKSNMNTNGWACLQRQAVLTTKQQQITRFFKKEMNVAQ